jgi:hypothetical protein
MARERILVTVKTYPTLSRKYGETVCTAGVREDGSWARIYPVPFRRLEEEQQYRKFDWLECELVKSSRDPRPETRHPADMTELKVVGHMGTENNWRERRELLLKKGVVHERLKSLIEGVKANRLSLAVFRPAKVLDFVWEEEEREWDKAKLAEMRNRANQGELFAEQTWRQVFQVIPKLPYSFSYRFTDADGRETPGEVVLEAQLRAAFDENITSYKHPQNGIATLFAYNPLIIASNGTGRGGERPVRDKQKLVEELRRAVNAATAFCATHQVNLPALEQLPTGDPRRLERLDEAVNALISPNPLRREFLDHERLVRTLFGAVKPDPAALEFAARVSCLTGVADAIRAKLNPNPADITQVMGDIAKLPDASITGVDMPTKPAPPLDLSKIDFEALRRKFKESKRKNTDVEILKAAIRAQLEKLIRLNKTRTDFAEKFEELIESYNAGSRNIEELFEELLALSRSLSEEQQRHVREGLTEEELVVFDILTRPAPPLSDAERAELKKVARDLLNRIKGLLVLNWRQKAAARAQVRLAIEDALESGLPAAYERPLFEQKCAALFEHIYESYPERDMNVYVAV